MRRDTLQDIALGLVLFVVAFWYNLGFVPLTEFHRDEARWIHRSYFLEELLDPASDLWRTDTLLTKGQPPLANYVMGLGLLVQGHELMPNGLYDMTRSQAWNRALGNVPSDQVLYAARRISAFVGALTVLCVFFIGRRLVNRVAGVTGALILIPHPLNTYLSTFAGSDAILVFLVAAAGLVAIALAERPSWPKAILLGVLLGLGGAAKLTPLFLALPLAGLGLALLVHGLPDRLRGGGRGSGTFWVRVKDVFAPSPPATPSTPPARDDLGWMLLTLPAVAFAAFVLVYPYLWPDPIGRTRTLLDFRTTEMATQSEIWENTRVNGPFEAIQRVEAQLGVWTTTSGWLAAEFEERFGRTWDRPGIDLKMGVLGLGLLGLWALMHGPRSRYALGGLVIGGEAALIVLGMQVDFNRYHLPILLAVVVGAGFLVGQVWNGLVLAGNGITTWSAGWGARVADTAAPARPPRPLADGSAARAALPAEEAPRPASSRPVGRRSSPGRAAVPGRVRSLLVAAALGLGILIGHSWAGLRGVSTRDRPGDDD